MARSDRASVQLRWITGLVSLAVIAQGCSASGGASYAGGGAPAFEAKPSVDGGKGEEIYPVEDLAQLAGYSDAVVAARFIEASPGQTIYDVDGKPVFTDRLQKLEVVETVLGDLKVGDQFTLIEDSWDGAGKGVQAEGLTWLDAGDVGLYFLDTYPADSLPYTFPVYRQTSVAGRVLRDPAGNALVSDPKARPTETLNGRPFQDAIAQTREAATQLQYAESVSNKAKLASARVPFKLPPLTGPPVKLATLRDSAGESFVVSFAFRSDGLACYTLAVASVDPAPDQCMSVERLQSALPPTQFLVLPLGASRALLGFSHESSRSGVVTLASGKQMPLTLQDVPGLDGVRFFAVTIAASESPIGVSVG